MITLSEIKQGAKNEVVDKIYNHFKKNNHQYYDEEKHCKLLIKTMLNPDKGTISAYCVEAMIAECTFTYWVNTHVMFRNLYYFSKMIGRELWEEEGRRLRDAEYPMGTVNYHFEYWKMIGWSRFGISKNSRLKLNLKAEDSPAKHYARILEQAAEGDFTAAEFKQLMEAVNVGLNVEQTIRMQKEIDELKSDLLTMKGNQGVQNPFTNKGTA